MDELLEERLALAADRLGEWVDEADDGVSGIPDVYHEFCARQARRLLLVKGIYDDPKKAATAEINAQLYETIVGDAYDESYTNPKFACESFGEEVGPLINWIAVNMRNTITAAYERDIWTITTCAELFLEMIGILSDFQDESDVKKYLREMIYYYIHDYDEHRMEKRISSFIVPEQGLAYDIVMNRDLSDPNYLYEYGEYISDNEIKMSGFLSGLSDDELSSMARTYTEGYRKGFEAAGIDLSEKKTVEIRYPIGMEAMVRHAVLQFRDMGLEPTFRRLNNTQSIGVVSTPANRQYQYDHRFDDALYINQALVSDRLAHAEKIFDKYEEEAYTHAGPAVIETFGEKLYVPVKSEYAPAYSTEQEEITLGYKRDYALLQDKFIPGDKRSFTIIAYPIPEIGDNFNEIFAETIRINNLDSEKYKVIHQHIIDALDQGEYVKVLGTNSNKTDMKVMLHKLDDPEHQTNFENCVADVNIPVGEVFTSPVLTGTCGTLFVSHVYLGGLRYENLELKFEDGKIADYTCTNFKDEEANKAYIKENVLYNHDTLPIGEFAIGTNTSAYVMGRRFDIEDKLPILIAEKTGPHFAVGDTCYSMSEEVVLHNPDGKEIIAKDNECSILRNEDPKKAYFQCHTDITLPYAELGRISVVRHDGSEIDIIREGKFVLQGTEELNKELKEYTN